MVSLPRLQVVQAANGYPRLCEAFALWFVIFTDKTLVEIGNTLAAPGLMLSVYVIGRRYSTDRVSLIGSSSILLLMPGLRTQTCPSMIDLPGGFFLIAAIHFATRPALRARDAIAATLCMVLVAASKSSALTLVPPIALVAYVRLLRVCWRDGRRQAIAI